MRQLKNFSRWLSRAAGATLMVLFSSSPSSAVPSSAAWLQQGSSQGEVLIMDVAADAVGRTVIIGRFADQMSLGSQTLTSFDGLDFFVAQMGSDGEPIWLWHAGGPGNDFGNALTVDVHGDIYITGGFEQSIDFGGTVLTSGGGRDFFVAKLASEGHLLWVRQGAGPGPTGGPDSGVTTGLDITLDAEQRVVVCGAYINSMTYDGTTFPIAGANEEGFVMQLDPDGNLIWGRPLVGSFVVYARAVVTDAASNLYVAGDFAHHNIGGNLTIDSTTVNTRGGRDIFLAKFDASGGLQWLRTAGSPSTGTQWEFAMDVQTLDSGPDSQVLLAGGFRGTASFGSQSLSTLGQDDAFLASYSAQGDLLWVRRDGGPGREFATDIATVDGKIWLSGRFEGTMSTLQLTSSGVGDIFIAEYNATGQAIDAKSAGGAGEDRPTGLALTADADLLFTGYFEGNAHFFGHDLSTPGDRDAVVGLLGKPPIASLTADFEAAPISGDSPLSVLFTDRSVAVGTEVNSYAWDFDDDGVIDSTDQSPSHLYQQPGLYSVILTISDGILLDSITRSELIQVSAPPRAEGLVGYWRFDEGAGCTITDSAGTADGHLTDCPYGGPQRVAGFIGEAVAFDGSDDGARVPATGALSFLDRLTLSAWLKHPPSSGFRALIDKRDEQIRGYDLYLDSVSRPFVRIDAATLSGQTSVADGQWHHLVATFDGDLLRLFVDGVLDAETSVGPQEIDTAADLWIGRNFAAPGSALAGTLDEVRIYNRALSDGEVMALFHFNDHSEQVDFRPPARTTGAPSGVLSVGTTETVLELHTDESAQCRFSTSEGAPFDQMTSLFATDDGQHHAAHIGGLTDGEIYRFYVRCRDLLGNTHGDDWPISFAVGPSPNIQAGLLGYWRFDEREGCLAHDFLDRHDGLLGPDCPANGPQRTDGRFGGGVKLDGLDDQLVVTGSAQSLAMLTVSAWIRHPITSEFRPIVDQRDRVDDGFDLYIDPSSRAFMRVNGATLSSDRWIADGAWHHVVGTYDGVELRLYVDGRPDSVVSAGAGAVETEADLLMGRHFFNLDSPFDGTLDEVRVYGRAFSELEALKLYSSSGFEGRVWQYRRLDGTDPAAAGIWAMGSAVGGSVAPFVDLDGDGVVDLLVGAPEDDRMGTDRGTVWIVRLGADGSIVGSASIDSNSPVLSGRLANGDRFGAAVKVLGDIDGDGHVDVAVGAPGNDDGGTDRGAVWLLSLEADGSVRSVSKIADGVGGFGGELADGDSFGHALTAMGDLNGDGTVELAVASRGPAGSGDVIWLLYLE